MSVTQPNYFIRLRAIVSVSNIRSLSILVFPRRRFIGIMDRLRYYYVPFIYICLWIICVVTFCLSICTLIVWFFALSWYPISMIFLEMSEKTLRSMRYDSFHLCVMHFTMSGYRMKRHNGRNWICTSFIHSLWPVIAIRFFLSGTQLAQQFGMGMRSKRMSKLWNNIFSTVKCRSSSVQCLFRNLMKNIYFWAAFEEKTTSIFVGIETFTQNKMLDR